MCVVAAVDVVVSQEIETLCLDVLMCLNKADTAPLTVYRERPLLQYYEEARWTVYADIDDRQRCSLQEIYKMRILILVLARTLAQIIKAVIPRLWHRMPSSKHSRTRARNVTRPAMGTPMVDTHQTVWDSGRATWKC